MEVERLRAWTYERQRLGRAAPNAAAALKAVVGVYSAHPSAPLSLHARAAKLDAAAFRRLDAVRLPAMRQSIHLLPRKTAHLAFWAARPPAGDRAKRFRHFGLTDERYEELRRQILKAAKEPLTQEELRDAAGAAAKELKGASAQMTRDGELLRVNTGGLRSNELRYVAADLERADPDEALAWLAGEYLRAFGPARAKDFAWWTGAGAKRAKAALAEHDTSELDDGLLILRKDAGAFEKVKPLKGTVDLLPKWDCLQMGYAPDGRDRFAHPDVIERCYDFRGDGRPVILVDGEAAGTWEREEPEFFDRPAKKVRDAAERRLADVKRFLG
jgi:hypothetical protein